MKLSIFIVRPKYEEKKCKNVKEVLSYVKVLLFRGKTTGIGTLQRRRFGVQ